MFVHKIVLLYANIEHGEGWGIFSKRENSLLLRIKFPGGTPVCRPVLQILTLFQTNKCHFSNPFSDLASKKLFHHYLD